MEIKRSVKDKKGSVEIVCISFVSIFLIFIFFYICFIYAKLNISIYSKKQDLFLIAQNAIIACDKEELAYGNISINEEILYQKINQIINLNYNDTKLKHVSYDKIRDSVDIVIEVDLDMENFKIKDKVEIKESIKLKLLEF